MQRYFFLSYSGGKRTSEERKARRLQTIHGGKVRTGKVRVHKAASSLTVTAGKGKRSADHMEKNHRKLRFPKYFFSINGLMIFYCDSLY
jgi:hypothetical protein